MKVGFSILILLICSTPLLSQNWDCIKLREGSSIACHIDSMTDYIVYFKMRSSFKRAPMSYNMNEIESIQKIKRRNFRFKPGSSLIQSTRNETRNLTQFQKNSVFIQTDYLFSVTMGYERLIPFNNYVAISARIAGGITLESGDDPVFIANISCLAGQSRNFFELGLGFYEPARFLPTFIPTMGYRYIGYKGLSFKIFANMLIFTDEGEIEEWGQNQIGAGLQIGYYYSF